MSRTLLRSPSLRIRAPSARTVAIFFFSLAVCGCLIGFALHAKSESERLSMEQIILEKSSSVQTVIAELLFKTHALSALVIQDDGEIKDFHRIAAVIANDPAIHNVLIAPGGIVADVFPPEGNEKLIGYNLLGPGVGNEEARMARARNTLVVGGPFPLMQGGGMALVGRLPVYLGDGHGAKNFWGLVSVTLKYPGVLLPTGLNSLQKLGFSFTLWRHNPDTDKPQVIAKSTTPHMENARYIERRIRIINTDWYLRIAPIWAWYREPASWLLICLGLGASLLVAHVVQTNHSLRVARDELEAVVHKDFLTGVLNRKGLFRELEKCLRAGKPFRLGYIDLNYFKQINDVLGHTVGDLALQEFVRRTLACLEPDHIFARTGGDEFVLVRPGRGKNRSTTCGTQSPLSAPPPPTPEYATPSPSHSAMAR